jgi:hypothetical protein
MSKEDKKAERIEEKKVEKEEKKAEREEKKAEKEEKKAEREEKKAEREEKKKNKKQKQASREEKRKKRLEEIRNRIKQRIKPVKHNDRKVTMFGELTVSGEGEIVIPIRGGRPMEAESHFIGEVPPKMGCGPITSDELTVSLEKMGIFPLWQVRLGWNVKSGNIRGLAWSVKVLR